MNARAGLLVLMALSGSAALRAQTTQSLIRGQIVDSQSGVPVAGAQVSYQSLSTHLRGRSESSTLGFYFLPLLPPDQYRIRVSASRYQAQELQELELPVTAFLEINFRLRPLNDVWEQGQYRSVFLPGSRALMTFFGPDVDSSHSSWLETNPAAGGGLESTLSQVIDPTQIRELPLAGRDLYTMLVTQPGVSADAATSRGLGLAVNGQRPSASNFLLDGMENNNDVSTGPLFPLAPEAIQEYRVSTSNFSAEFGKAAGFLANGVTAAGGNAWHGLGYLYWKNSALNANDLQRNLEGLQRAPLHETNFGFLAGGPLRTESLLISGSLDAVRNRNQGQPVGFTFPAAAFTNLLAPGSPARRLLELYPAPAGSGSGFTTEATMAPTISLDRYISAARADYLPPGGKHRVLGRWLLHHLERPDFSWSPYRDFIAPLRQDTLGLTFGVISNLTSALVSEGRIGWSSDDLRWDRPHPDVPTLESADGTLLPSSPMFYGYQNVSRKWELGGNLLWAVGRHVAKWGAGVELRTMHGHLTAGRDPQIAFASLEDFGAGLPFVMTASFAQPSLPVLVQPDFERSYRNRQWFFFAQDSFQWRPGLALNVGLRYENFGAPVSTGRVKDALVRLGPGETMAQRISGAQRSNAAVGDQRLYDGDGNNLALRFGFSYKVPGSQRTLVRGAYGIFYDRPFDNLWQNIRSNSLVLGFFTRPTGPVDFLKPLATLIPQFRNSTLNREFFLPVLYQPHFRDAYAQSWFFGTQHSLTNSLLVEADALGALGRKLITSDRINRQRSIPIVPVQNPLGRFNPGLPDLAYRASQGSSNYHALAVSLRYRSRRSQLHAAYTWSHAIDNQSDPLEGDFLNLGSVVAGSSQTGRASFARQFDSGADRGNADFDQRHNLVLYSIWELPPLLEESRLAPLLRDWTISQLAAFRSGFPFTVTTSSVAFSSGEFIYNNRATLLDPMAVAAGKSGLAGGVRLLNRDAFAAPIPGTLGNSGRNAFGGPGLFSIDLSLSRSFGAPWISETIRFTLRADLFNVLNHANLNNPDSFLDSPTFGTALYGRQGRKTGFPAETPFEETARQVQLMLRIAF